MPGWLVTSAHGGQPARPRRRSCPVGLCGLPGAAPALALLAGGLLRQPPAVCAASQTFFLLFERRRRRIQEAEDLIQGLPSREIAVGKPPLAVVGASILVAPPIAMFARVFDQGLGHSACDSAAPT